MDRTLNTDIDVIDRFVIFSFLSQEDLNFFRSLQQGEINDTTQSTSQVESKANSDNRDLATTEHATKMVQKCSDSQYQLSKPSSSEMCENKIKRNRKLKRKLHKKNQSNSSSPSGVAANSVQHLGGTKTLHNQNRKLKKGGKRKLQAFLNNRRDTNSRSVINVVEDMRDITKRKRREKEFRKKQSRSNSLIGTCMHSLTDVRSSSSKALPIKRWCVTCPEDQLLHERRKNSNIRLRFQAESGNKTKLSNAILSANNNSRGQSPQPDLNDTGSASMPISEVKGRSKRNKRYDKNQGKNCKAKIICNDLTRSSQVESMKSLYSRPATNTYASDTDTSDFSRKVTHNKKERERRSKQKSLFYHLQQSHPDLIRLEKCPKIKILQDAVDLIHKLCNEEREMVNIKMTLRDKNAKLRDKLNLVRT